jgi:hypothetical protein
LRVLRLPSTERGCAGSYIYIRDVVSVEQSLC